MVRLEQAPFGRSRWTHVVFTLDRLNAHDAPPKAHLYVDGRPVGSILGHDLTFGWDPSSPKIVLGAAYVGDLDDVAAWRRALTPAEVAALHALPNGASSLRP